MDKYKYAETILPNGLDKANAPFWNSVAAIRRYLNHLDHLDFDVWMPTLMKNMDHRLFFAFRIMPVYTTRYERKYKDAVKQEFQDVFGVILEEYELDNERYLVMPIDTMFMIANLCRLKGMKGV